MSRFNFNPMERRRANIRKASIFALIFALFVFLLGLNGREPLRSVSVGTEDVFGRVLTVISMPVRGAEKIIQDVSNFWDVGQQNKRLRAELAHMSQLASEDRILREQVKYLETVLSTDIDIGLQGEFITARAVSENDGPFVKSALINAGANRGVVKGQAVVTADGFYGRVVRHGQASARVLLLNDLSSRVPVMSLRSRSRAILTGTNDDMPQLEFRGDGDWDVGDYVVTSGDGGDLPAGLSIGQATLSQSGDMVVKLDTDKTPVDWVRIVPFQKIEPPESSPVADILLEVTDSTTETPQDEEAAANLTPNIGSGEIAHAQ